MSVAWPAFLGACALELLVFAFVDPLELQWGGQLLGWSRPAAYTAGFFAFWAVGVAAATLAVVLAMEPEQIAPLAPMECGLPESPP